MSKTKSPKWTTDDWIKKLKQQAENSSKYRHKLYNKVDLRNRNKILDVGCGTGAVTLDIASFTNGEVIGIDIDTEKLQEAERALAKVPNIKLMETDILDLPFDDGTFDLVVFNIVMMHIKPKDQSRAVAEMARVTKKGGFVLGTCEPDYEARVEYPEDEMTQLIFDNIKEVAADVAAGRKLKVLFNEAGLQTEVGIDTEDDFILIKDDRVWLARFKQDFWLMEKIFRKAGWTTEQIEKFKKNKMEKIKNGLSFMFIPCFYAIGKK